MDYSFEGGISLNDEHLTHLERDLKYFKKISRLISGNEALEDVYSRLVYTPEFESVISSIGYELSFSNNTSEEFESLFSRIDEIIARQKEKGNVCGRYTFRAADFGFVDPFDGTLRDDIDFYFLPENFVRSENIAVFARCLFSRMRQYLDNPSAMLVIDREVQKIFVYINNNLIKI